MSYNQKENFLIPRGTIWECKQVATQPVGVPATMGYTLTIPEGERGLLLALRLGPDNYGAERGITARLNPSAAVTQLYSITTDTVDNLRIVGGMTLVTITETTVTSLVIGLPYMPYILPEKTEISIEGGSLANAETLTGHLLIATRIFPPVAAVIGAGVTLTTNTILQV